MSMAEAFVTELQMEGASTRKLLERIPEDKLDYKPHEKSMTVRELASHIVESLEWTEDTVTKDGFEMDMETYKPFRCADRAELLRKHDEYLANALKHVAAAADADLLKPWTMTIGGQAVFTMPRAAVLRMFIISHSIHHRGQLDVYLRLLGVALPQIYGPTADEPDMVPAG